jgi:hypothetical protein
MWTLLALFAKRRVVGGYARSGSVRARVLVVRKTIAFPRPTQKVAGAIEDPRASSANADKSAIPPCSGNTNPHVAPLFSNTGLQCNRSLVARTTGDRRHPTGSLVTGAGGQRAQRTLARTPRERRRPASPAEAGSQRADRSLERRHPSRSCRDGQPPSEAAARLVFLRKTELGGWVCGGGTLKKAGARAVVLFVSRFGAGPAPPNAPGVSLGPSTGTELRPE